MRKFLITVALATTTLAAVPAAAQYQGSRYDQRDDRRDHRNWNQNHNGPSRAAINELLRDLNRVENRIQRSAQNRVISPREAVSLRREAHRIRVQLQRSGRNGLTGREFAQLRVAVNRIEQRLRVERRDRDGRRW